MEEEKKVRIYVGGLGESVTAEELRRLFQLTGGVVESVDFVRTKGRSLAYVDFLPSTPKSLSNLFAKYNGCAWKGGKLRLEKAKEHYLVRLTREWSQEKQQQEEEAQAQAQAQAQPPPPPPSHIHRKQLDPDNTNLIRIYFPRLYKVKSLPFSGSGKHKYSFQRVDVPSLPKYFCDCEEHSLSVPENEKDKQVAHVESESGGINEQELDIMNKVMNSLFQSQSQNHDQDEDEDEDNLIINVVTKDQAVPSLGTPQLRQEPRPKRGPLLDVSTVKKGNDKEPPFKKKKSLVNDKTSGKEFESPVLENKEGALGGSNKSAKHKSSASWTQKSSWKELLGDSKRSSFSISESLFSTTSAEKVQPSSDTSPDIPDSDNKNNNMETDGELENTSCIMKTDKLIAEEEAQPDDKEDNLERNGELENTPCRMRIEELVVQEAQPADKKDNLERDGELESTPCRMETEDLVGQEAQPADEKVVSNQIGRGAFWRHKSSWTQLIGESSSFSISQVIPGVTANQQITTKPKNPFVANFANAKNNDIVHPTREVGPNVSEVGKERDGSRSTQEEKQQTVLGNNESSMLMLEEKGDVAAKQTSPMKVEISSTCSFMRSATSLKEWAKTKAALSGSLKKQGTPK
ncbi:protein REPRESSOR OF SILENCING 3 [Humulus lupulus]|uniref:protein REPRESSOR OF SILENCING 3 n=1 Tax=Humulus lupulus TaxID=3486 RepID=UPI002B4008DB|nr:protein REPRESSOR OF SILENCING 3 [Humulus lupulus]